MKIHHIAIWTKDIENMKNFYVKYFGFNANNKYSNAAYLFESYCLEFSDGAKLELMKMPSVPGNKNDIYKQYTGLIHFAISAGSKENVKALTEKLRTDGYEIVSEPEETGDGFFESCILDPEKNRIEITYVINQV